MNRHPRHMNIAFVCKEYLPSKRAGGIASYIYEMAHGLTAAGHKVTVVTASDDTRKSSDTLEDGIRVIRLSGGDFTVPAVEGSSILKKLRCAYRFHSYRKKIAAAVASIKDLDVIEVADFGAEGLCLGSCGVPVVLRLHTPSFLDIPALGKREVSRWKLHRSLVPHAEERILKSALYVSSCSQSLLTKLRELVAFSPRKTAVIRNPAKCGQEMTRYKREGETATIFYAGTIVETKGVGDLIDACTILRQSGVSLRLVMAGKGGAYAEALKRREDTGWITFCGHLDRNELMRYYADSDVCCFPSWWENMPMVCLEAMSCGAIVVGSTSGGMKEIVEEGVNGFLVDRKSPAQLAKAINKAINMSDEERESMGASARKTIASDFSIVKITNETEAFYRDVIDDFKTK